MNRSKIASLDEIAAFWTDILRSEDSDLKDKLKVSEMLIKALGGSIESSEASEVPEMGPEECMNILRQVARQYPEIFE